ncbi:bifunctional chorismate mutase/prephenate dehydratase [Candidatus Woesebacteria bacterium]|nr:bifunctional chorismate mutase/prephenate dehydratase [Candidatus Woesebacteria bacterium]
MSIITHIGKPGSFSHAAARMQYGADHTYIGCSSFEEVFCTVAEGNAEIGVIPLENSLAGSIYENYDLFDKYFLHITAEQYLKVEHFLLCKRSGDPASDRLQQLQTVYSHPKALEQCKQFFNSHPWMKPTVSKDTATAAFEVASSDDFGIAAIGSLESAHLYRLQVLKRNVEDDRHNYTRFVYISKQKESMSSATKCSLQFEVKHEPGSLVMVLNVLKDRGLNMTKIESRPIHGKPFEYRFYMDFEFDSSTYDVHKDILEKLKDSTHAIKLLGLYASAKITI